MRNAVQGSGPGSGKTEPQNIEYRTAECRRKELLPILLKQIGISDKHMCRAKSWVYKHQKYGVKRIVIPVFKLEI